MLTVVIKRLIKSLSEVHRRKHELLNKRTAVGVNFSAESTTAPGHPLATVCNDVNSAPTESNSDRTTQTLLAVLLLFLITEFPQGILGILSGVLGDDFFNSCYLPIADLMDLLALFNSAVTFLLYCTMSSQFRGAFARILQRK